ncbi:MAG TPA: response regulator [Verrucomicrobiae bacterium]
MLRILHLEDSEEDAYLVKQAIEAEGINAVIEQARNRQQFISALEHGDVNVIISDSGVPELDGLSALKMVRQKYPGIQFIYLSGQKNPKLIKASIDAGANDYISKSELPKLTALLRRESRRLE